MEGSLKCERIVISEELDQKKRHFHLLHLFYTHLTLLDYPVHMPLLPVSLINIKKHRALPFNKFVIVRLS